MFSKYSEANKVVIPVRGGAGPDAKAPVSDAMGFNEWSINGQPDHVVEMFQQKYPVYPKGRFGIAVVVGPASNLCVIDVDSNDKRIIDALPKSPVLRVGSKDRFGALFFKYNPTLRNQSLKAGAHGIDILCDSKYIIVPPSRHQSGVNYAWAMDDLLNWNSNDLPTLHNEAVEKLVKVFEEIQAEQRMRSDISTSSSGRNNKLKAIITAMATSGDRPEDIFEKIYKYDYDNHNPPLFYDKADVYGGAKNKSEALNNARKMTLSVMNSLAKKDLLPSSEVSHIVSSSSVNIKESLNLFSNDIAVLPRATGLLGDLVDFISNHGPYNNNNLSMGGSIALLGTIFSHRYSFCGITPNVYVLNIAPTGAGKGFSQSVIKQILFNISNGKKIMGRGGYYSSRGITQGLNTMPVRLDVIDEFSMILQHITKSNSPFQMELIETLSKLWSSGNDIFVPTTYASLGDNKDKDKDKDKYDFVYNPCVSLLGSATQAGVEKSLNSSIIERGLLPRFLIFRDGYGLENDLNSYEEWRNSAKFKSIIENLNRFTIKPPSYEDPINPSLPKGVVDLGKDIKNSYKEISSDYRLKMIKYDGTNQALCSMYSRAAEQVAKIACIHAAGNDRGQATITDLDFATKLFDASFKSIASFLDMANTDDEFGKKVQSARRYVDRSGHAGISEAVLRNNLQLDPGKFSNVLTHLLKSYKIGFLDKKTAKGSRIIVALKDEEDKNSQE